MNHLKKKGHYITFETLVFHTHLPKTQVAFEEILQIAYREQLSQIDPVGATCCSLAYKLW